MNIITNSVLNMKYAFHAENGPKLIVNDVQWIKHKRDTLETVLLIIVRLLNKGGTRNIWSMC